jgi:hypothetical protein
MEEFREDGRMRRGKRGLHLPDFFQEKSLLEQLQLLSSEICEFSEDPGDLPALPASPLKGKEDLKKVSGVTEQLRERFKQ